MIIAVKDRGPEVTLAKISVGSARKKFGLVPGRRTLSGDAIEGAIRRVIADKNTGQTENKTRYTCALLNDPGIMNHNRL